MSFKVTKVVDGDTFEVSPGWKWKDKSGNTVRPIGWDSPEEGEPGYDEAQDALAALVFGKSVERKGAVKLTYGRLLCRVLLDGRDIAGHLKTDA